MLSYIKQLSFRRLLSMYVCLKTLCLSWKMKHTRSNIHAQYTSIKLIRMPLSLHAWVQKPSACEGFCHLRQQKSKKTLPLSSRTKSEPKKYETFVKNQTFFMISDRPTNRFLESYRSRYYINTSILTSSSSH